ncbi:GNAT family N-acetyltransferase [Methylomonas sp. MgM2]
MIGYQIRYGEPLDEEWLYDLYCRTMRSCIEATWGWNESFQRNGFCGNLHPVKWKIVSSRGEQVGGFVLNQNLDHFWLEMIIIKPECQRTGIGQKVIAHLQDVARKSSLPLRLSVIKANPVKPFYLQLGFKQFDEDDAFYKLEWKP